MRLRNIRDNPSKLILTAVNFNMLSYHCTVSELPLTQRFITRLKNSSLILFNIIFKLMQVL